jgi:hypothetical protein
MIEEDEKLEKELAAEMSIGNLMLIVSHVYKRRRNSSSPQAPVSQNSSET